MKIVLKGIGIPTDKTGRIYSMDVAESIVSQRLHLETMGGIDHPEIIYHANGVAVKDIELENVSHYFRDLRIEDNNIVGILKTVKTSAGKKLEEMMAAGVVDFGMCGYATFNPNDTSIVETFSLHSINAIHKC